MDTLPADPWIVRFQPRPDASHRVFCFPYAGGGAFAFREWARQIAPHAELIGIQPPGRESRIAEPLVQDMQSLVQDAGRALSPWLDKPSVFFGHSLGALLAFEVARSLRDAGLAGGLRSMVLSGCAAPHLRRSGQVLHTLADGPFVDKLRDLNGTPSQVFEHPELLAMVLPILRNDFFLSETYHWVEGRALDIPLYAWGGDADPRAGLAGVAGWVDHTSARPFEMTLFRGDHFFIHSDRGAVIERLNQVLGACKASP